MDCAVDGPMPGTCCSCAAVAVFKSIGDAGADFFCAAADKHASAIIAIASERREGAVTVEATSEGCKPQSRAPRVRSRLDPLHAPTAPHLEDRTHTPRNRRCPDFKNEKPQQRARYEVAVNRQRKRHAIQHQGDVDRHQPQNRYQLRIFEQPTANPWLRKCVVAQFVAIVVFSVFQAPNHLCTAGSTAARPAHRTKLRGRREPPARQSPRGRQPG